MRRTYGYAAAIGAMVLVASTPRAARAQTPAAGQLPVSQQSSAVRFTFYAKALFTLKQEGRFAKFDGEVAYDPANPADTRMDLIVYTASVDTQNADHDAMLRSTDFFDIENYPTMHFVSDGATVRPDGGLMVSGDLTIRGVKKRIEVPVQIRPAARGDAQPGPRFETTFDIDRTEFGLNGVPKWGGMNVSVAKNVKIHLAIATALPRLPR
jgi:polyisoprenoid-binding protein YceI